MAKIFKGLEEIAKEGGMYNVPKPSKAGSKHDTEADRTPPSPDQTPIERQGETPEPTDPQQFTDRGSPERDQPFDHQADESIQPGPTNPQEFQQRSTPERDQPFQHEERENIQPSQDSPFQHQSPNQDPPPSPDRDNLRERAGQAPDRPNRGSDRPVSDKAPEPTEPFDHVAAARERGNQDEPDQYDHTQNQGDTESADTYDHQQDESIAPDESTEFSHEEREDLRPDETTRQSFEERERPSEDRPFQHEERTGEIPAGTDSFDHQQDETLEPESDQTYDHQEREGLTPDATTPFEHQEREELQPSEDFPFEHTEREDLTPDETGTFDHSEDEGLRPSDDQPFEHVERTENVPTEASQYEHQQNEDIEPPEDQTFQHEEREDLTPDRANRVEHEEREDLRPADDETFQHEEHEDQIPAEEETFEHTEDGTLRPTDTETFQHEEREELRPTDAESFEHEENENLRPADDQRFEHEENEDLTPAEDQPFQHEQDETLEPTQDQTFEHTEDETLKPSGAETFQHEQDERLEPSDDQAFDHTEDESLRPAEDESFQHEQDESLEPSEDETYQHEEDPTLRPTDDEVFEHEQDESLEPADDETYDHQQDESFEPAADEVYEHEEDESLRPADDEAYQHEEDPTLRPTDDETYDHQQNESLEPDEDQEYDHTQNAGTEPADPDQTPLDDVSEVNEGTTYPNYWSVVGGLPVTPDEINQTPLDKVLAINEGVEYPNFWRGTLEGGSGESVAPDEIERRPLDEISEANEGTTYPNYWSVLQVKPIQPDEIDQEPLDPVREINVGTTYPNFWIGKLQGGFGKPVAPDEIDQTSVSDILGRGHGSGSEPTYWDGDLISGSSKPIQPDEIDQTPLDEYVEGNEGNEYPNYWSVLGLNPVSPDEIDQEPLQIVVDEIRNSSAETPVYWDGPFEFGAPSPVQPVELFLTEQNTDDIVDSLSGSPESYWSVTGANPIQPDEIDQEPLDPVAQSAEGSSEPTVWGGRIQGGSRTPLETREQTPDLDFLVEISQQGTFFRRTGNEPIEPFGDTPPAREPRTDTTSFVEDNENIRIDHWNRYFDVSQGRFDPPFVLTRPDSDQANQKQADSRVVPYGSTIQDQERLGKFFLSPKGVIFQTKQAYLQGKNPRKRTRVYDPTALQRSAVPYVHETRHLDPSDNLLGRVVNTIFDGEPIKSSKFSDEVGVNLSGNGDQGNIDDPRYGYLIYSIPNPEQVSGSGEDFAKSVSGNISSRIDKVHYRHSSTQNIVEEKLSQVKDRLLSRIGLGGFGSGKSKYDYFLGTRPNTGFYSPDPETGSLHPSAERFMEYNFTNRYGTRFQENRDAFVDIANERAESQINRGTYRAGVNLPGIPSSVIQPSNIGGLAVPTLGPESEAVAVPGSTSLQADVQEAADDLSEQTRSSENVAQAFYARSDGNSNIAAYENLPKGNTTRDEDTNQLRAKNDQEAIFYENRIQSASPLDENTGERIVLHRGNGGEGGNRKSRGLPNYEFDVDGDDAEFRQDLFDTIGVLDRNEDSDRFAGGDWEDDIYRQGDDEEFEDMIPFKIYDETNQKVLIFRSFLESINLQTNINWDQNRYLGRPEQFHIYSGADRSVNFSLHLHPFSKEGLKNQYEKLNYLQGLAFPAGYRSLVGGGVYMVPPFTRLTLGDIYNRMPGYISSLDINMEDGSPWSLQRKTRLPEHIRITITYTIIEEEVPQAGSKLFDYDFNSNTRTEV